MIELWKNQGMTIVIAEHRLNYLQDIADRFVFMKCGRIETDFTAEKIQKNFHRKIKFHGIEKYNL